MLILSIFVGNAKSFKTINQFAIRRLFRERFQAASLALNNFQQQRQISGMKTHDGEKVEAVITTPQGQVRGVRRCSIYDHSYYSFEGIPFGKPPLGELRFRAPLPAEGWTGIRDCSQVRDKPVQKNIRTGEIEGSEDCLYLNIYVKTLHSECPLPVMVWIHGGSFHMGEGSRRHHGPDYFMQEEVIIVSFNYRLCSLGFLSLADPELNVPGNAGLKDQVLALKWIKQNIANFNGDANNITVFGESAGAASAHYMAITERTKGLFHKVILMSGCALNYWANIPQVDHAYRLAVYHGYQGTNNDCDVLTYLKNLEPNKLVEHELMNEEDLRNGLFFLFAPCVEPYSTEQCVISRPPLEMMKSSWSNGIPMIIGGTSYEGLLIYPLVKLGKIKVEHLKTVPEEILPVEVRQNRSKEERKELAGQLIRVHLGERGPNAQAIFEYVDLQSYKAFWHGLHRVVLSRLSQSLAATYLYRFDFDSLDFNFYRLKYCGSDPVRGAAHADDLPYIFLLRESWKLPPEKPEYKTIQRLISMWTSFAKYSDPNNSRIEPVIWKPLQKGTPNLALNISNELKMIELPEATKLKIWNGLYKKEELY